MLRELSLTLRQEVEKDLPLTKDEECVRHGDVLDLSTFPYLFYVKMFIIYSL